MRIDEEKEKSHERKDTMQFGIGILVGFALSVICLIRVETGCARHTFDVAYQKGYEDAEMQYKKAVKPVIFEENTADVHFVCPCCGRETVSEWKHRPQYCADCGCKIDWEE